jgi:RES domain-containing protein
MGVGRWNELGTPMIYASSVSSLNFLELLSIKGHVVTQSVWKLSLLSIELPIPELNVDNLPADWKNRPYPRSTQEFGSLWAKRMISPVLKTLPVESPWQAIPKNIIS